MASPALSYLRALAAALRGLRDEPTVTQVASAGYDLSLVAVGSSPFGLDPTSSFLAIPEAPTTSPENRYLQRICGLSIPPGKVARLLAVGEYIEIGAFIENASGGGGQWVRQQVTSPGWAFSDGNTCAALTTVRTPQRRDLLSDPRQELSTDPNLFNLSSALVYVPATGGGGPLPYQAPNAGVFPGSPVEGLGLWRDARFRWSLAGPPLDYSIEGGRDLFYWASTKQTDPDTRPELNIDPDQVDALSPEDRLVYRFPGTRYTRRGGYLVVEIGPSSVSARQQGAPDTDLLKDMLRKVLG